MGQLVKLNKIIPFPWDFPIFILAGFTLEFVGQTYKSVICNFLLQHFLLRIYETTQ